VIGALCVQENKVNEREKLKEARYFAQRMEASVDDPQAFQYELSAFLSAARSVLQYAFEEATKTPVGRRWYEAQVSGNAVLEFFKDKRDLNIHVEPVRPSRHIDLSFTEHIMISESVRIETRKEDGTTEVREHKEEPPKPKPQETSAEVRIRYVFVDWGGSEDVIDLSYQYLAALENSVKAWLSSGVISG
jgi:hypothetical protein